MHIRQTRVIVLWSVCLVWSLALPLSAAAQNPTLTLGTVTTLPGDTDVSVPLLLTADDDVTALEIGVGYDDTRLMLTSVTLAGGELEDENVELFEVDTPVAGETRITLILDSDAPFDPVISGTDEIVLNLIFDVNNFQFAGTENVIEFIDLVDGELVSNEVSVDGDETDTDLVDGSITITDEDHLVVRSFMVDVGDTLDVPIIGFNIEEIKGFSVAIAFDPDAVSCGDYSVEDTITESVDAEFVASDVSNDDGEAILGVLLDFLPPFDDQVISAAGIAHTLAILPVEILEGAAEIDETTLDLQSGIGDPPINNVFVVNDQESTTPVLIDGILDIRNPLAFVRGEANQDGFFDVADPIFILLVVIEQEELPVCQDALDVNDDGFIGVVDAIYLLNFLFQAGVEPPAPYPDAGFDTTEDDLPCFEVD